MSLYKIFSNLNDRQINVGYAYNPEYYRDKIIKSYFDSSKSLYNLKCDFNVYNNNFCFSPNGNFMAVGNSVFKLIEDLVLIKSSKINKDKISKVWISSFNQDSSKIIEYGYNIYKEEFFMVNDIYANKSENLIPNNWKANNISTHPSNSNLFAASSTDNELFLRDLRSPNFVKLKEENIKTVQYNPTHNHLMLVTSTSEKNFYILDIRNLKPVFQYDIFFSNRQNLFSARYNKNGSQIFLVLRRSRPVLYNSNESYPIFEFDELGYSNFINAKYCCFAGPKDEYVVASSDDNNVFIWEIPDKNFKNKESNITLVNTAKFILRNFSIESSVEYNNQKSLLGCLNYYGHFNFWSPIPFDSDFKPEEDLNRYEFSSNLDLETRSHYCKSNIFNLMIFKINILICYILKNTLKCLDKNYFIFEFESFLDVNSTSFINEFKRDLNISYIKLFINNRKSQERTKKHKLLRLLQKNLDDKIHLKSKILKYGFITILLELYKIFFLEDLIMKSIKYLDEQLDKLKKLKKKLISTEVKKLDYNDKIDSICKLKIILKSMKLDLQLFIMENKDLFDNKFYLIKKLIKFLIESSYRQFSFSYYNKLISIFNITEFKRFKDKNSKSRIKYVEKEENKVQKNSELFDEDLNKNLIELKKEFKIKKKNNLA